MTRPLGIAFLCLLNGVVGGVALLGSFAIRGPFGLVTAVTAVFGLLSVYGVWTFKAWGWLLMSLLYAGDVIYQLFRVTTGTANVWHQLGIIVGIVVLLYLYRKRDLYLSEESPTKRKDKRRESYRNP